MAFDLLKDARVLRDREQQPLIRVALRAIKDFAIPLEVGMQEKELYWKWYLLPNEFISNEITKAGPKKEEPAKVEDLDEFIKPLPKKQDTDEKKKTEQAEQKTGKEQKTEEKKETNEKKELHQKNEEEQKTLEQKEEPKKKDTGKKDGPFLDQAAAYFQENAIEIADQTTIKKGTEADYTLLIPSAVGKLTFYCKAKGKKTIADGDLSSAYVTGEAKKLPVLFLTNGKLAKRAKEMLGKEFKNIIVKEI
jgi:outer membrane biosynthesis protein TonB